GYGRRRAPGRAGRRSPGPWPRTCAARTCPSRTPPWRTSPCSGPCRRPWPGTSWTWASCLSCRLLGLSRRFVVVRLWGVARAGPPSTPLSDVDDLVGGGRVVGQERLIDLHEHFPLPFGQVGGREDRVTHRAPLPSFEDPRTGIEHLGRPPEPSGDLRQHLRGGLAETAFDLTQVRVRDAGTLGELPDGHLGRLTLCA